MIKKFDTYINESLKDKMVGKSEGEIVNTIKDMEPEHQIIYACKFHMTDLVKELINSGIDPSFGDNMCLTNCGLLKYNDIVEILLKNEKVIRKLYESKLNIEIDEYEDSGYYDYDDATEQEIKDYVDWKWGDEPDDEEDEWVGDEEAEENVKTTGPIKMDRVEDKPKTESNIKKKIKNFLNFNKKNDKNDD